MGSTSNTFFKGLDGLEPSSPGPKPGRITGYHTALPEGRGGIRTPVASGYNPDALTAKPLRQWTSPESNREQPPLQGDALPLSYRSLPSWTWPDSNRRHPPIFPTASKTIGCKGGNLPD